MSDPEPTVITALGQIRQSLESLRCAEAPPGAQAGPNEQVLVRYTDGEGRFSEDGRYIILKSRMYRFDGAEDGHHEGVFQSRFSDPSELLAWPAAPHPPLDAPGPVLRYEPRADTKAIWTFGDGSSIVGVGFAAVHLAPFKDGTAMFFVAVGATITGGTGRFEGTHGIKTALGGTLLANPRSFGPGSTFPGRTVETFRVIFDRDLAPTTPG